MLSKFILKYANKAIFLIGGFIILALAIMLIVMFSNTGEKTPVTCEQLNTKLIDMGYEQQILLMPIQIKTQIS